MERLSYNDFAELIRKMRAAQNRWFKEHKGLSAAKNLEALVDKRLENLTITDNVDYEGLVLLTRRLRSAQKYWFQYHAGWDDVRTLEVLVDKTIAAIEPVVKPTQNSLFDL
jgi:hypothetical protein